MKNIDVLFAQLAALLSIVFACIFSPVSQAASVSDLLITEIMANPAAVSDTNGEWFELFNPTSESIDLGGMVLSDSGSNNHIITGDGLLINSGDYFVLARNGVSATNGGFTADYVYGSSFTLNNSSDQIIISDSAGVLQLDYSSGFVPAGASMELVDAVMLPGNFTASTSQYGAGDLGTPGMAGSFIHEVAPSPVPVPAAIWLMGSGLLGLIGFSRPREHRE